MTGTLSHLLIAMAAFLATHFLLAWPPIRARLVGVLGEKGFLAVYSTIAILLLVWTIAAYRHAPRPLLWDLGIPGRWVPILAMPLAMVLVVAGLTTRSVTAVGGHLATSAVPKGIITITRHPFLWGAALWALAHLAANGDAASLILFGGIALLSVGGMAAIDHKRSVQMGPAWEAVRLSTSALPFGAQLSRRMPVDWRGIGMWRPLLGLVVFAALLHLHKLVIGVSPLPGG